jgi:hypothetical protein
MGQLRHASIKARVNGTWNLTMEILYFDGMIIGGGCGAPFAVLN